MKISVKAKSSSGEPYDVTVQYEDGFLTARCTCKAGIMGMVCKHRLGILRGDKSMLAVPSQAENLAKITQWAEQTGFSSLLQQLDTAEVEVAHAELELKKLKKRIEENMTRGLKRSDDYRDNLMTQPALAVLDHIVRERSTRENRVTELLRDPLANYADGWYMCVPAVFNDALDIKQTERVQNKEKSLVWTQGSSFSFKEGDTLYDTPDAYQIWSEALKSISLCIQVKSASSAGFTDGAAGRSPGSVTFLIFRPNNDRSKIIEIAQHTMSQDDFVRFLIAGPSDDLTKLVSIQH
jgi:hypothetical protein